MNISIQEYIALTPSQDPAILPFAELQKWIDRVFFVEEERDFLLAVLVARVVLESLSDLECASKTVQTMKGGKSKMMCLAAIKTRVLLDNGFGFNTMTNGSPQ